MSKKVFLGVGHGGRDPGAQANGFKEKDLNLAIALACRDELERHGVQVLMSRTKDEDDKLTDEIKECNAYKPDLCVDIHNNAGGGDGFEVYYFSKGGTSLALAKAIEKQVIAIGQNSRGCKTKLNSWGKDWFGWIRETTAPAVLVECAFVDNKADLQIIDAPQEQKNMGVAVAKGILSVLGIAWIKPTEIQGNTNYECYTVKPNDSWWKIASEQLGSGSRYIELVKYNGLTERSVIHPGQVLRIPK